MLLRHPLFASSFALLLAACGGNVSSDGGSGGTTATGGGGGATSTGGAGGATSNGGSGGATSTGGSGGSAWCNGSIALTVDGGVTQTLTATCAGYGSILSDAALGFAFAGGPAGSPHGLRIVGCSSNLPSAFGIVLDALDASGPGTVSTGLIQYTDANGIVWGVENDPFLMTLTTVEPTGGVIEGSFEVMATHGGDAAHSLTGTFHVCHVEDQIAP